MSPFGDDDMARNVWNEQQRDAAPSPDEVEQMIRDLTCDHCGEPNDDGETVSTVARNYHHDCPANQQPWGDTIHLCRDCRDDHDPEADYVARFRERDDAYVRFACGIVEKAETPEPPMIEVGDGEEVPHPHADTRPRVPIECQCGAALDGVL